MILPYYSCIPEEVIERKKHEGEFHVPKGYHWDGEMRLGTQKTHVFSGPPRRAGPPDRLQAPKAHACSMKYIPCRQEFRKAVPF